MHIKNKINNFLFGKFRYYNWALLGILAFALILRFWVFKTMLDAPIWWDSGDYLSFARKLAFNLDTVNIWSPRRPFLMPLVWAGLLKIADSEALLRFSQLIFSFFGVLLTYLLTKEVFNKKIGLIASFCMSVFWLHLFLTGRFLVGLPSATFLWAALYFFWRGYVKKTSNKEIWLSGVFIGLTIFARASNILMFLPLLVLAFTKEKFKFFKNRNLWITLILIPLVMSPFIIWLAVNYSNPLQEFTGIGTGRFSAFTAGGEESLITYYGKPIWEYIAFFTTYLQWPFLILFLIGLFLCLDLFLGLDLLFKKEDLQKKLFLFVWIAFPIIFFGAQGAGGASYLQPRYLIPVFPAVFSILGLGLLKVHDLIAKHKMKYSKIAALLFVMFILLLGGYYQLTHAKESINSKKDSYLQVKQAALWMKESSNEDDAIISNSIPQTIYYSDRSVHMVNEDNVEQMIKELNPKFLVVSIYEKSPQWFYEYPSKKKLDAVKVYTLDGKNPSLVIYQLRS